MQKYFLRDVLDQMIMLCGYLQHMGNLLSNIWHATNNARGSYQYVIVQLSIHIFFSYNIRSLSNPFSFPCTHAPSILQDSYPSYTCTSPSRLRPRLPEQFVPRFILCPLAPFHLVSFPLLPSLLSPSPSPLSPTHFPPLTFPPPPPRHHP